MELEYRKCGDYYIPNLVAPENMKNFKIEKYGNLRLRYLKDHKKAEYTILLMDNKLQKHLIDVDTTANKIIELKGLRENLWRKHKRIKTFEEGQLICSEIQKLATKIDELNKDIKLCNFIEENTLRMKDNIKEVNQENQKANNKILKKTDRYYR